MAVVSIKNKLRRGNLLVGNEAYDPAGFDSIATVTVGATSVSTITFSSIPATYTHLQVRAFAQTNRGTYGTDGMSLRINGDSTGSYIYHYLRGNGSTPIAAAGGTSASNIVEVGTASVGTVTGGTFGAHIIDILDYANTNKYKTMRNLHGNDINGTVGGSPGFLGITSALWMKTDAITSLVFTGDNPFTQYTHFALYGIKSA
jgi:hypothetical protein